MSLDYLVVHCVDESLSYIDKVYMNCNFDSIDLSDKFLTIKGLEFNIYLEEENDLWDFIDKNSKDLYNLEYISFYIENPIHYFHGMISSICKELRVEYIGGKIIYNLNKDIKNHMINRVITDIF